MPWKYTQHWYTLTRRGADQTSVDATWVNIRCDQTSWRSPYLISAQSWASSQPSNRKPANRAISVMWRLLKVVQEVGGYDHTAVKRQLHSPLKCLLQLWPTVPPSSPVPMWGLQPNSPDSWHITIPPTSLLIVEDNSAIPLLSSLPCSHDIQPPLLRLCPSRGLCMCYSRCSWDCKIITLFFFPSHNFSPLFYCYLKAILLS